MKSKLDGAHICAGRLDQNIGRMADNLIASKSTINATYDGVESIRQEVLSHGVIIGS